MSHSDAAIIAQTLVAKGLKASAHHETLKKAWREQGMPHIVMDLPRVRVEMTRVKPTAPVVGHTPSDGGSKATADFLVEEATDPWLDQWKRAGIEATADRIRAEAKRVKTKDVRKSEKLAELKAMRAEAKLVADNARAVAAAENPTKEDSVSSATKTKKTTKAKRKPAAGAMSHAEILADLQKRYPHVKAVSKWNENGKATDLIIQCPKLTPECAKTREIHVQGAFQVKTCEACKAAARKIKRIKARKSS